MTNSIPTPVTAENFSFVHLNCHSSYSLLQAIPSVKTLSKAAAKHKMPAMGITDTHNVFGAVWIGLGLMDEGVQPILGSQVDLITGKNERGEIQKGTVTLLVMNDAGWRHLLRISSKASFDAEETGAPAVHLDYLKDHSEGLICLTGGGRFGPLGKLIRDGQADFAEDYLLKLKEIFGNRLYMDIQRHGLPEEVDSEPFFKKWALAHNIPFVATNDCRFMDKSEYDAYEVMLSIREGMTMSNPDRPKLSPEYNFKTAEEMVELFSDIPEACANTLQIAQRCAFTVPLGTYYMPDVEGEEGDDRTMDQMMTDMSWDGLQERMDTFVYPFCKTEEEKEAKKKEYHDRLQYELDIIIKMGYSGYFLITADFIQWSKDNDIPVGPGRGSGAGSLVAWCMKVTDVDPIPYDLYFERFLNPERVSMPDFDIDFCTDGRMKVVDYVRKKYGDHAVSQIITYGSLLAKGCIRDVGRVMELPFPVVNRVAGYIPGDPGKKFTISGVMDDDERLRDEYENDEDIRSVLDIAMKLEGAHRHTGVHAAGVIIAGLDIQKICALWKDPRAEMPAVQFDMIAAEMAGLVKFDFLGLKNLTVIKRCLNMVKENFGKEIDPLLIPMDDDKTFDMLRKGHTIGVFQVESKGMTDFLVRMEPDKFSYLSDVIALYRPGPLESGMTDDFIECRHGRQDPKYPHPALKPVLEETFGVPVYQEQVMRMAQVMAGYTLGEADMLRRAMGKKKVSEMDKHREIFAKGAEKLHGVKREESDKIFSLMANFAGYGFNKAHTVAYGLVSYQTAYFKAHYPLEFIAASMTMDRGTSDKILKFKRELERMEVPLYGPNINMSRCDFRVEEQGEERGVRFALTAIKGAGEEAMAHLVRERDENGKFKDIFDFIERLGPEVVNRKQLEVLIMSGGFDEMYPDRSYLFNNVDTLLAYCQMFHKEKNSDQIGLFGGGGEVQLERPKLVKGRGWDPFLKLEKEQKAIGFYLSSHPLNVYDEELRQMREVKDVVDLENIARGGIEQTKVASIIHEIREVKTKSGDRMGILTISDSSGQNEVAMFPKKYREYESKLELNKPSIMTVQLNFDEEMDRVRMNVDSVGSLEDAIRKDVSLNVHIDGLDALDDLKEVFGDIEKGTTNCKVFYKAKDLGTVVIQLPHPVNVTKKLKHQLKALQGVSLQ